ncbi:MAG: molybdopterin molybdotransferase MoeA [Erythrobacter sp.]|nr:molybdopterin molybdotransferase MoeA [Erythrobacter sp.]
MLDFDAAIAKLEAAVQPLPTEEVPLGDAAACFLAEDLCARGDAPARAISAMDGYAVAEAATRPREWLTVAHEIKAGTVDPGALSTGEVARIFTGAPLPEGADCVIMQEYAERDGAKVHFSEGYGPARHVREAGSDFRAGDTLLKRGNRLTPRAMVSAAAADVSTVEVFARPRIAIIATGDELAPPGSAFETPGALPESASFGVAAMAEEMGAQIVSRSRGGDELDELTGLAGRALDEADCVVVTGGASVGDHDLARPMFGEAGLDLVFSRIAIKPGKPVWLGTSLGKMVIGLPGNPTSAMVTARLFLRPLLAAMQGGSVAGQIQFLSMPLAAALPPTGSRETFIRARATANGLVPRGNQESGSQAPLAEADWLIRRPAGTPACEAGSMVQALDF